MKLVLAKNTLAFPEFIEVPSPYESRGFCLFSAERLRRTAINKSATITVTEAQLYSHEITSKANILPVNYCLTLRTAFENMDIRTLCCDQI